jgi:hypothetical protein
MLSRDPGDGEARRCGGRLLSPGERRVSRVRPGVYDVILMRFLEHLLCGLVQSHMATAGWGPGRVVHYTAPLLFINLFLNLGTIICIVWG